MERKVYSTDLTDKQWEAVQEYLPRITNRGANLRK